MESNPTSALSCRSETCDFSSVSVSSMEIKTLCSLRSLREIYNHHTDVFFPHAEDAKSTKILLNNTCAREVAGYARQENAEAGGNQWLYSIFVCHPTSALSCRSETCDFSSASVSSMEIKPPRSLRSLREIYNYHTDVFFPHAEDAKVAKILLITLSLERSLAPRDKRTQRLAKISSCLLLA